MAVTRDQLSAAIHRRKPDLTREKARIVVDTVLDEMANALLEHGSLRIRGFGVFAVHRKPARPGRNMQSGESCEIGARRALTFRPSSKLVDAVNAGKTAEDG